MPQCNGECGRLGFRINELVSVDGKLVCSECAEKLGSSEGRVLPLRENQPTIRPAEPPAMEVSADEKGVNLSIVHKFLAISIRFEWAGLLTAAKTNLQKQVLGG